MKFSLFVTAVCVSLLSATAKGPFQLTPGTLTDVRQTEGKLIATFTGSLTIGGAQEKVVELRLRSVPITASKYSILLDANSGWRENDFSAFAELLSRVQHKAHRVRGAFASPIIEFDDRGAVRSIRVEQMSMIDSTVFDAPH